MAQELAGHGITVNAVAPGETATPMTGLVLGGRRRDAADGAAGGLAPAVGGLAAGVASSSRLRQDSTIRPSRDMGDQPTRLVTLAGWCSACDPTGAGVG
ncbi:MAG TPA: hypothetical protein VFB84_10325 [Micromonosporaceae bacterium]|nr:hypothetical protein [Micromonosporaceae bacterium]